MRGYVLFALMMLGLSTCGVDPQPPRGPLVAVTERQYSVREAVLDGGAITVRLEIPTGAEGPRPAVLANLNESTELLDDGIVAVSYKIDWARLKDAPPPLAPRDQSVGKWVLAAPSAGVLGEHYLRMIVVTATRVIPRVIDYLETVDEIDASRLGISGGSTNGFIALQAIAADKRLRVGTAIAACGDYRRFLQYSSMGMEGRPLALDPAYTRWIRSQEPIAHPGRLVHAALLMANRVQDPLIPIACADQTDRVFARAYARQGASGRYRYVRIEELAGHGLGSREHAENLAWLRRWLVESPRSSAAGRRGSHG